jgi:hypothetical protein
MKIYGLTSGLQYSEDRILGSIEVEADYVNNINP